MGIGMLLNSGPVNSAIADPGIRTVFTEFFAIRLLGFIPLQRCSPSTRCTPRSKTCHHPRHWCLQRHRQHRTGCRLGGRMVGRGGHRSNRCSVGVFLRGVNGFLIAWH